MDDLSTLTPFELKEHIDQLRKSAADFECDARKYQEELDKRDQKDCEKFVGKCYRTENKYFKVIGVPRFILTISRIYYEPNQLPAIIVEVEGTTFDDIYEDIIYRAVIDAVYRQNNVDKLFPDDIAEEITEEEFDEFLNEKVRQASGHIAAVERSVNW